MGETSSGSSKGSEHGTKVYILPLKIFGGVVKLGSAKKIWGYHFTPI